MRQLTSKMHNITTNNEHYVDSSLIVGTEGVRRGRSSSIGFRLRFICLVCICYAVTMTVFVPSLCVLLSYFTAEAEITCFPFTCFLAVYLSINLFGNWIFFRGSSPTKESQTEQTSESTSTVYSKICSVCDSDVDRDTSHCPICNVCVYRRDHHCFFLGSCAGRNNLQNFIAFCTHACIGCLYATLLLTTYLRLEYRDLWSKDFLYYFVPYALVGWCTGAVVGFHFLLVVVLNGVATTFVSTLGMVAVHLYLVLFNLTSYEMWRSVDKTVRRSRRRSFRNFELTFGHDWQLGFLWPRSNFIKRHTVSSIPETAKYV